MKLRPWCWESIGAICCFAGGIAAAIMGSALTALTWILGGELHPWVRAVGTGFLVLTIPLLILAGYFLDWLERKPKKSAADCSAKEEPLKATVVRMDRNVEIAMNVETDVKVNRRRKA